MWGMRELFKEREICMKKFLLLAPLFLTYTLAFADAATDDLTDFPAPPAASAPATETTKMASSTSDSSKLPVVTCNFKKDKPNSRECFYPGKHGKQIIYLQCFHTSENEADCHQEKFGNYQGKVFHVLNFGMTDTERKIWVSRGSKPFDASKAPAATAKETAKTNDPVPATNPAATAPKAGADVRIELSDIKAAEGMACHKAINEVAGVKSEYPADYLPVAANALVKGGNKAGVLLFSSKNAWFFSNAKVSDFAGKTDKEIEKMIVDQKGADSLNKNTSAYLAKALKGEIPALMQMDSLELKLAASSADKNDKTDKSPKMDPAKLNEALKVCEKTNDEEVTQLAKDEEALLLPENKAKLLSLSDPAASTTTTNASATTSASATTVTTPTSEAAPQAGAASTSAEAK